MLSWHYLNHRVAATKGLLIPMIPSSICVSLCVISGIHLLFSANHSNSTRCLRHLCTTRWHTTPSHPPSNQPQSKCMMGTDIRTRQHARHAQDVASQGSVHDTSRANTLPMQGAHGLWHKKGWYTGCVQGRVQGTHGSASVTYTHCFAGLTTVQVRCTAANSRHTCGFAEAGIAVTAASRLARPVTRK